jgi:ribosome-associated protein
MNITEKENLVCKILDDLKGIDIKVLNVESMTCITDRMILCTGRSNRHVTATANNLITELKKLGIQPFGLEGVANSDWVLIDLGDIIVHVMQQETRDFYNLEALWGNVPVVNEHVNSN